MHTKTTIIASGELAPNEIKKLRSDLRELEVNKVVQVLHISNRVEIVPSSEELAGIAKEHFSASLRDGMLHHWGWSAKIKLH